jgi:peptide/nickel transport system substrate-binding protein
MKLSKHVVLAVLMIVALLVVSCATPAPAPAPAAPKADAPKAAAPAAATAAPAAAKAPAAGVKTRFTSSANLQPPEALHANLYAPPGLDASVRYIFDPLFDFVPIPTPTYHPMLGESFKEEGNKLTITLRKDAKWTDDKPFTSKDVITTYHLYFITNHIVWRYLDKIEAPDDYTVVMTWKKASPILKAIAFEVLMVAPTHIYGKWAEKVPALLAKRDANGNLDDAANKERNAVREELFAFKPAVTEAIGTGPFKVGGVTTSDMMLQRKENSWASKNNKYDEVVIMRYVAQEAYITNAVSGKYDGDQHGMPPDVFEQLKKAQPDMYINWSKSGSQPGWDFNMRKPPLDKPEVRKAIVMAIDFKSVLPILEPGTLDPDTKMTGLVPSFRDRWVSKETQAKMQDYSFNKAKAEELLTSIGWKRGADKMWQDKDGKPVQLEIASMNSWPIFFLGGDAYAQQLTAWGLKTVFKPMELAAYWTYLDNGEHMIGMDFRANIGGYGHPWGAYKNLYRDHPVRMGYLDPKAPAGSNYELKVKVAATGETIDVLALTDQLFYATEAEAKVIVEKLALATNELVPFVAIGEKAEPIKIYAPNKKVFNFPGDEEPYWFQGLNSYARMMKLGKISPTK